MSILYTGVLSFHVYAQESSFVYDSKDKRDPFIPLIGKNVSLTDVELLDSIAELTVEGIIIDPQEGSACIVNGRILREGDFMGGFRLKQVSRTIVIFERDGEEYSLRYKKDDDMSIYDEPIL